MALTNTRRLEQLETRAKKVAAARPEPHTLCFIEPVNSTFETATGKWAQFDASRDPAEFEPAV
jgi:hypothetical protein